LTQIDYVSSVLNIAGQGHREEEFFNLMENNVILGSNFHNPLMLSFIVFLFLQARTEDLSLMQKSLPTKWK